MLQVAHLLRPSNSQSVVLCWQDEIPDLFDFASISPELSADEIDCAPHANDVATWPRKEPPHAPVSVGRDNFAMLLIAKERFITCSQGSLVTTSHILPNAANRDE
jgi:hypothetical protein